MRRSRRDLRDPKNQPRTDELPAPLLFAYALVKGYQGMVHMDGNNKDDPDFLATYVSHLERWLRLRRGVPISQRGPVDQCSALSRTGHSLDPCTTISLAAYRRFSDTTNSYRGYSRRLIEDPRIKPFRKIFNSYNFLITCWYELRGWDFV